MLVSLPVHVYRVPEPKEWYASTFPKNRGIPPGAAYSPKLW
jgi:hypothetical protein